MKSEAVRWVFLALVAGVAAEKWKFPEGSASVRIDTKLQFVDDRSSSDRNNKNHVPSDVQGDDPAPFQPARDTSGFYNRPADAPGRYPVRVETHEAYRAGPSRPYFDGTVDSLLQCKCVSNPECDPSQESSKVCGPGKFLCCAKRPGKATYPNPEFFNEVEDERPELYPGQSSEVGPFPPISGPNLNREFSYPQQQPVLIGPGGPSGNIGPQNKPVLVGPNGPTGIIGPMADRQNNQGVLVGPDGPTGVIGPVKNQRDRYEPAYDVGSSESAQRGVLVGPGGPTGIIGPAGYGRRPVLVGPGGPTGVVGPYGYAGSQARNPGILVGPGGPTGIIGPGRQILVGPGGPTGQIGPRRRPFYYEFFNERDDLRSSLYPEHGNLTSPFPEIPGLDYNMQHKSSFSQWQQAPSEKQVLARPKALTRIIRPGIIPIKFALRVGLHGPINLAGPAKVPFYRYVKFPHGFEPRASAQQNDLGGSEGPLRSNFARNVWTPILVGRSRPLGYVKSYEFGGNKVKHSVILVGQYEPTSTTGLGKRILIRPGGPMYYIRIHFYNRIVKNIEFV